LFWGPTGKQLLPGTRGFGITVACTSDHGFLPRPARRVPTLARFYCNTASVLAIIQDDDRRRQK